MKNINLKILSLVLSIFYISGYSKVYSTTHIVTVSDFAFTQSVIFVNTGDSVKWVWINGSHTTTCDGSLGTFRPPGAPPWNSSISSSTPSFTYIPSVEGKYIYICIPHFPGMAGVMNVTTVGITPISEVVSDFSLSQNYPNPFNPNTKIRFSLRDKSDVSIKIFNSIGQEVDEIVSQKMNAGIYEVDWNAGDYSNGVYYYSLTVDGRRIDLRKMILLK